jgi:integrase
MMDEAGLSARAAADQLGHSRVTTAQDTYFGRRKRATGAAKVLEALG